MCIKPRLNLLKLFAFCFFSYYLHSNNRGFDCIITVKSINKDGSSKLFEIKKKTNLFYKLIIDQKIIKTKLLRRIINLITKET